MLLIRGQGIRESINLRTTLVIAFTTLISTLVVFCIVYVNTHSAMIESIKRRSSLTNDYAMSVLKKDSFTLINAREDMSSLLYMGNQSSLNWLRKATGAAFLYTAKRAQDGSLVYILDGSDDMDAAGFRRVGDPVDPTSVAALEECLTGQVVHARDITHTSLGQVFATYWPVTNDSGEVIGALGIEFDATLENDAFRTIMWQSIALCLVMMATFSVVGNVVFRKMASPFYKRLAYMDFLTNTKNRNAFELDLKQVQAVGLKGLSIAVFDLNDLKVLNDSLGHAQGDQYLRDAAKLITHAFQQHGDVYRIGGDEFAAVITDAKPGALSDAMSDFARDMASYNAAHTRKISISVGSAAYEPAQDQDIHDVLRRADAAMYAVKQKTKRDAAARA